MTKRQKHYCRITLILLICIMTFAGSMTAGAAVNKALKMTNASFSDKTNFNRFKGAELCAAFLKNDKLKKSGMKFSATVYIPKKALKNPGDMICIDGYLYLQDPKAGNKNKKQSPSQEWPYYLGAVETQYDFYLQYNEKKQVEVYKHNWDINKKSKAGNYASVKKKSGYYIVTLKNVPYCKYYFNEKNERKKLVTNKSYLLSPSVLIISETAKSWKGNLYADDLKVKTAKMTQTVSFDTKDYKGLYASNWQSGAAKYSIKKPMK